LHHNLALEWSDIYTSMGSRKAQCVIFDAFERIFSYPNKQLKTGPTGGPEIIEEGMACQTVLTH
jgi:hypothetical protein